MSSCHLDLASSPVCHKGRVLRTSRGWVNKLKIKQLWTCFLFCQEPPPPHPPSCHLVIVNFHPREWVTDCDNTVIGCHQLRMQGYADMSGTGPGGLQRIKWLSIVRLCYIANSLLSYSRLCFHSAVIFLTAGIIRWFLITTKSLGGFS